MSAYANFFVISKTNFEEYRKMAHLEPYEPPVAGTRYLLTAVGSEEIKSPEFQKKLEYARKLWDFLRKNGKEPYDYKWSGYVLDELLGWLKEAKDINLMEIKFVDPEDAEFFWLVFDQTIKKKYVDQLNPDNFKEEDVIASYEHLCEQQRDANLKEMASKLSKEELKSYIAKTREYDDLDAEYGLSKKDARAQQAKAMMDGINILHRYMKLIEDQTVVILNIG